MQYFTSSTPPSTNVSAISLLDGSVVASDSVRPPSLNSSSTSVDESANNPGTPPMQRARSQSLQGTPTGVLRHKTSMQNLEVQTASLRKAPSLSALKTPASATPTAPSRPSSSETPQDRISIQILVENLIIPHTLNICVNDKISETDKTVVLDSLIALWKKMCVVESNNKVWPQDKNTNVLPLLIPEFLLDRARS